MNIERENTRGQFESFGEKARFIISNWHNGPERLFRRSCLASILLSCLQTSYANPSLPQVVYGQVNFANQGKTLTVTNSPNAIINWQNFSIEQGETTRFIQQNANSSVLNRILGQDPSRIFGSLQSNGRVFLINPNGILFGPNSQIDVNGLVASSLAMSNQDFLLGKHKFSASDGKAGKVSNAGNIRTPNGGQVYLIAPQVENSGVITSPNGEIILAAGRSVQLVDSANPDLHVVVSAPEHQALNLGELVAQAGKIGIYGALVKQRGTVNANSANSANQAVLGENGKVRFQATRDVLLEAGSSTLASGGSVHVLGERVGVTGDAKIDVSAPLGGGSILLGGDYQGANSSIKNALQTYVGPDVSLHADATMAGDGGKIIAWSERSTQFHGSANAHGTGLQGKGGLIETSSKQVLDVAGARVNAHGPQKNGLWLLDPSDITVVHGSNNTLSSGIFDPSSSSSIGDSQINASLNSGTDVTLQTSNGTGGTGLIRINGTADAGGAVQIANRSGGDRSLSLITSGSIDMRYGATIDGVSGNSVAVNLSAGTDITLSGTIDAAGAALTLVGKTALGGTIRDSVLITDDTFIGSSGTLDNVTLKNTLDFSGTFLIKNGLTLANAATVNVNNSSLYFQNGSQTISSSGAGVINLAHGGLYAGYGQAGDTLTIGSGVTVQGYGLVGESNSSNINNLGTIHANTSDKTLQVAVSDLNNSGVLKASTGALVISQTNWTNSGTLSTTGGVLNLNFNSTTAGLGSITNSGGKVNWNGVLDNANAILDIGASGVFGGLNSLGGTIKSGTVRSNDATVLSAQSATLDGVQVSGNLDLSGTAIIHNGITLSNGASLNIGSGALYFAGSGNQHIATSGDSALNVAGGTIYAGYGVSGQTLNIDSGVTLQGYGSLGNSSVANIINYGKIDANSAGKTLTVNPDSLNNQGVLAASAGTLTLAPDTWLNSGTIDVATGTLNLNFATNTNDLGTVTRTGGTVNFGGVLDNTGMTLDIGKNGPFGTGGLSALTGTIKEGTLISGDGSVLQSNSGTLDAVHINGNFSIAGSAFIKNGVNLAQGAHVNIGTSILYFPTSGSVHVASAGPATIDMAGGALYAGYGTTDQTLYLDSQVTLQGWGYLSNSSAADIVNQGTIHANVSGKTFTIVPDGFNNQGAVVVDGGIMQLAPSNWTNTGTLKLNSGTMSLDFDTTNAGLGAITHTDGELNWAGVLDNSNATLDIGGSGIFGAKGLSKLTGTIKNGTLLSSDATPLESSSGVLDGVTISGNLTNTGSTIIKNGINLAANSMLDLDGSSWLFSGTGNQYLSTDGNATINLTGASLFAGYGGTGQSLHIDSGITMQGKGYLAQSSAASVINAGIIDASLPTQSLTIAVENFTNSGTLAVNGGNLQISPNSSWSNSGTIQVNSGNLLFNVDTTTAGLGTISRTGGLVNYQGTLDNSGSVLDIGASGQFGTGGLSQLSGTIKNGTLTAADGSVLNTTGIGTLDGVTLSGNLSVKGGTFIKNNLSLKSGSTLTLGSDSLYFNGGGTQLITSDGPAIVQIAGGSVFAGYGVNGQILQIEPNITMQGYGSLSQSAAATLLNKGTILANVAGQGLSVVVNSLDNKGMLKAQDGTLHLMPTSWSNTGSMATAGDGMLNLQLMTSTAQLGSVTRNGGSVMFSGILDNTGETIDLSSNGIFGASGLNKLSGTIKGGTLQGGNGNALEGSSGSLDGVRMTGIHQIKGDLFIKNGVELANDAQINLDNSATWYFPTDGAQHISTTGTSTLNLDGSILYAGYGVNNQTLHIDSGVTVQGHGTVMQSSSAKFINDGSIHANANGKNLTLSFSQISNTGTLGVSDGTLWLSGLNSNQGVIDIGAAGVVATNSANLSNADGGVIRGAGHINLGTATLSNLGSIQPGAGNSAATLKLTGNFAQSATGVMDVEVHGSANNADKFSISGTASLDGSLHVTASNGYVPAAGDQYSFMSYLGSPSGSFATVNAPSFNGGSVDVSSSGVLRFVMPGNAINFWNFDGSGDWSDPTKWSLGHVPTAQEDVQVPDYASQFTITLTAPGQVARSVVFVGNDKLSLATGSLTLGGVSTIINGSLDMLGSGELNLLDNLGVGTFNFGGTSQLNVAANKKLTAATFQFSDNANFAGPGGLMVTQAYQRTGGMFQQNVGAINLAQQTGNLLPGAIHSSQPITLTAQQGDIVLNGALVTSGARVTMSASQGAISADANGSVTSSELSMLARDGISGLANNDLQITAPLVQANNLGSGDIKLNSAAHVQISDLDTLGFGVKNAQGAIFLQGDHVVVDAALQTTVGDINLKANKVSFPNHSAAKALTTTGDIVLSAAGVDGITLGTQASLKNDGSVIQLISDAMDLAGAIQAGSVTSAGHVSLRPFSNQSLVVESSNSQGHLSITPTELANMSGNTLTLHGGQADVSLDASLNLQNFKNVWLSTDAGDVTVNQALNFSGNDATLHAASFAGKLKFGSSGALLAQNVYMAAGSEIDLSAALANSIGSSAASLNMLADKLNFGSNAPVIATTGSVNIGPYSEARDVHVVASHSSANALELVSSQLQAIQAGSMLIGSSPKDQGRGNVSIHAALDLRGKVKQLSLVGKREGQVGGGISQQHNAPINVENLKLFAADTIDLGSTANVVDVLSAPFVVQGSVNFVNSKDLTVGAGGHGIEAGGLVNLEVETGGLTLSAPVVTPSTVRLHADTLQLNSTVTSNHAQIMPSTVGRTITIGGANCVVSPCLLLNDLYKIAANSMVIGESNHLPGRIDVAGLTVGNSLMSDHAPQTLRLDLISGGDIAQSAPILGINEMSITSAGALHFTKNNSVNRIAGTSVGAWNMRSSGDLRVTGLTALPGSPAITGINAGGAVTLQTSGGKLVLESPLTATGRAVQLSASAAISGQGLIKAQSLNLTAGNGINLNTAVNTLNGHDSGNNTLFRINNIGALNVEDINQSNGGPIEIENIGGVIVTGPVQTTSGDISFLAHSPLTINGTVKSTGGGAIQLSAGASQSGNDVLTLGSNAVVETTGGILLQAGDAVVQKAGSSVSPQAIVQAFQNGVPPEPTPTIDICIANPATAGCSTVLPSLDSCVSAPNTAGCGVVLPSLATCTIAPSTAGCSVVLPTLAVCMANPSAPGCSSVLPSLAVCLQTPSIAGCGAVLPSLATCTISPSTAGCSVVLPTLEACITDPSATGCGVVLPNLATCLQTPTAPGCSAVLPSLATCIISPSTAGCNVILPTLASCIAEPSAPGCGVVLPSLATCIVTPSALGCNAVLPTFEACKADPSVPGCMSVLPSLATCLTQPSAQGCSVILPSLTDCVVSPSLPGCSVVLPTLASCLADPTANACSVVLPNLASCTSAPSLPGCSVILPTLNTCIQTPEAAGCKVILPGLDICQQTSTAPGCSVVLPKLDTCISAPSTAGCGVILPTLANCSVTPSLPGCSVVLPSLAACTSTPTLPGCSVVLPSLADCLTNSSLPSCTSEVPVLNACLSNPSAAGCKDFTQSAETGTPSLQDTIDNTVNLVASNTTKPATAPVISTVTKPSIPETSPSTSNLPVNPQESTSTDNKVSDSKVAELKPSDSKVGDSKADENKENKPAEKKEEKKDEKEVVAKKEEVKKEEPAKKLYCN